MHPSMVRREVRHMHAISVNNRILGLGTERMNGRQISAEVPGGTNYKRMTLQDPPHHAVDQGSLIKNTYAVQQPTLTARVNLTGMIHWRDQDKPSQP
jgi:hypothetical protein